MTSVPAKNFAAGFRLIKAGIKPVLLTMILLGGSGCAARIADQLVKNLNGQTDIELLCEGGPAYLLMLDSLIADSPSDKALLQTGIRSYIAFASVLTECNRRERTGAITEKARDYAFKLLTNTLEIRPDLPLEDFTRMIAKVKEKQVPSLFWAGYGWASWIYSHRGEAASLADLPRVELIMQRVIELDEGYYFGSAHLFMGVYYGSRPAMLGGNPRLSKKHFEAALALSGNLYLPARVAFAEFYARTTYDPELFKRLLQEVLDFEIESAPSLVTVNLTAQKRARRLLRRFDDFF